MGYRYANSGVSSLTGGTSRRLARSATGRLLRSSVVARRRAKSRAISLLQPDQSVAPSRDWNVRWKASRVANHLSPLDIVGIFRHRRVSPDAMTPCGHSLRERGNKLGRSPLASRNIQTWHKAAPMKAYLISLFRVSNVRSGPSDPNPFGQNLQGGWLSRAN